MSEFKPVVTEVNLGGNLIETYDELEEHLHDDIEDLQFMCKAGVFPAWLEKIGRHEEASKIIALDFSDSYPLYKEICGILGITENKNICSKQSSEPSFTDHDASSICSERDEHIQNSNAVAQPPFNGTLENPCPPSSGSEFQNSHDTDRVQVQSYNKEPSTSRIENYVAASNKAAIAKLKHKPTSFWDILIPRKR